MATIRGLNEKKVVDVPTLNPPTKKSMKMARVPKSSGAKRGSPKFGLDQGSPPSRGPSNSIS